MDTKEPTLLAEKRTPVSHKRRSLPATIDEATGLPVAPIRQRTPLKSLEDVKRELGRVYRAMKAGTITHESGTKRAYVLDQLGKVIQLADLERRIATIEREQTRLLPAIRGRDDQ